MPELENTLAFFQTETKNAKANVHLLQLEKKKTVNDLTLSLQSQAEMKQQYDGLEYQVKMLSQEKLQRESE